MWGGTVLNEAALKAIVTTTADDGLVIRVKNVATYQLDANSTDATAIAPNSGVGRWLPTSSSNGGNSSGLTANRTYYVDQNGSDSNDGLTSGTAFLTIQKAIDTIALLPTLNGFTATIQIANSGSIYPAYILKSIVNGQVVIQGNAANRASVNTYAAKGTDFEGKYTLKDLTIYPDANGDCIRLSGAVVAAINNVGFEGGNQQITLSEGALLRAEGNYSIRLDECQSHLQLEVGGCFSAIGRTIAVSGNVNTAFLIAKVLAKADFTGSTFSGSANGKRYEISGNSAVRVPSASTAFLPGNIAGTLATGGQLV